MIDPVWDDIFKSRPWGNYPDTDLVRFMARNYHHTPANVIDIGCGTGANLEYLIKAGYNAFGVDGSKEAVRLANARTKTQSAILSDITGINFADGEFDVAIDIEAIYANTVDDSMKIYGEIHRLLKHGGKLFTKTFADGTDPALMPADTKYRFSTLAGMKELLNGFVIENIEITSRTESNMQYLIREWLITARKP